MSGEPWFGPKRYGYGLSPANWKGWAFTVVMLAILVVATRVFRPAHDIRYWIGVAIWLAVLITVSVWKSAGKWRWRWGDADSGNR